MRQFQGGDFQSAGPGERLDCLEATLTEIEELVADLLRDEDEGDLSSPLRVAAGGRLFVLLGGLAAIFGVVPVLPPQNPIREVVTYTVSALVQQMPGEVPDVPDMGGVVLGNPDRLHRPLHPAAMLPLSQMAAVQPVPTPTPTPTLTPQPTPTTPGTNPVPTPASVSGAASPAAATPAPTTPPQAAGAPAPAVVPAAGASLPPATVSVDPVATPDPTPNPTAVPAATLDPTVVPTATPEPSPPATPEPSPSP